MRVLILGGTGQARLLAEALTARGVEPVSSLAGRTTDPAVPAGLTRVGGFGGPAAMTDWLRESGVTAVVDATHPFAGSIGRNAVAACRAAGLPLLRYTRPSWADRPEAGSWLWSADHAGAAAQASALPGVVLLTVGRQHTPDYLPALAGRRVIARLAEARGLQVPTGWSLLEQVGPFTLAGELELFAAHRVAVLVAKDSGGQATEAKLDAAARLGVTVIMITRPPLPPGVPAVTEQHQVLAWLGLAGA